MRDVGDGDDAAHLLQQPADELLAAAALLQRTCYEGNVPHELQDGAGGLLKLLLRGGLLADCIAQLFILEDQAVSVKSRVVGRLLSDPAGERPRGLLLDAVHDLELGSAPVTLGSEDDEHLGIAAAASSFVL